MRIQVILTSNLYNISLDYTMADKNLPDSSVRLHQDLNLAIICLWLQNVFYQYVS